MSAKDPTSRRNVGRLGIKLRYAPRSNRKPAAAFVREPSGIPPMSYSIPNFVDGRPITYTLLRGVYQYQVGSDTPVLTDARSYPQVAALARRKYGVPPIGCASLSKGVAA